MKTFLIVVASIVTFVGIVIGGSILVGTSITKGWSDDYASTTVFEHCEIEGYYVSDSGRYSVSQNTLKTSCGDFKTRAQEDLYALPIGEVYTLEVTNGRNFVAAAVNEKDLEAR